MKYYDDLTKDEKRVTVFKEAILKKSHGIVFDLGTGSGILATFASTKAKKVFAYEINPFAIKKYSKELKKYENIELINADLTTYSYSEKPDVVICEMLDTALIDEEQVPVINNVLKYTNENTIFIPKSTYDTIQLINSDISHITYKEGDYPQTRVLSDEITYNSVDFSKTIKASVEKNIKIPVQKTGEINGIQIITYTCLTDEIITQPTPMLNPPLLIPTNKKQVNKGDVVTVKIKYVMGGGLNTIRASIQ